MDDDLKYAKYVMLKYFFILPVVVLLVFLIPDAGMIFCYLVSGSFALLGIYFFMGKGMWLTTSFKPMSPKEKEEYENKYDTKKIQKAFGVLAFLTGVFVLLSMTGLPLLLMAFLIIGIILGFTLIVIGMNTSHGPFIKK
jgi:hypothetical protein